MLWGFLTTLTIVLLVMLFRGRRRNETQVATGPTLPELTDLAKRRIRSLSPVQQVGALSSLRADVDTFFDGAYSEAMAKGLHERVATELALFRAAAVTFTGQQIPLTEHEKELQMETVPFNSLPPQQAKAAFKEYTISKFFPEKADYVVLYDALRAFGDDISRRSAEPDPDVFIYNAIFREKCDWQRYLASDVAHRFTAGE